MTFFSTNLFQRSKMFTNVTGIYKSCSVIKHIAKNSFLDQLLKLCVAFLSDLMGIFNARAELEVVFEKTVRRSLFCFDFSLHHPIFFTENFALEFVDLIIEFSFWSGFRLLDLFSLIFELNLSEMIKVVVNVVIGIFVFLLIALVFSFSGFFRFLLFPFSELLLKLLKLFIIELVIVIFHILILFVELLSIKSNIFF